MRYRRLTVDGVVVEDVMSGEPALWGLSGINDGLRETINRMKVGEVGKLDMPASYWGGTAPRVYEIALVAVYDGDQYMKQLRAKKK